MKKTKKKGGAGTVIKQRVGRRGWFLGEGRRCTLETGETLTLSFGDGEGAKDLTYDLLDHRLNFLHRIFCSMILHCYFRRFNGLSNAAVW